MSQEQLVSCSQAPLTKRVCLHYLVPRATGKLVSSSLVSLVAGQNTWAQGRFCNCSLRSGGCFQSVMGLSLLFSTFSPDLSVIAKERIPRSSENGWRTSHVIFSNYMNPGLNITNFADLKTLWTDKTLCGVFEVCVSKICVH